VVRPSPAATLHVFEKYQQLTHRHAPSFIRHVLDAFRQHTRSAVQAAAQLGLSPSRLYALATAYNTARARAGNNRSGRPALPVAIMPRRGRNPSSNS
jgi:hypothetical protein